MASRVVAILVLGAFVSSGCFPVLAGEEFGPAGAAQPVQAQKAAPGASARRVVCQINAETSPAPSAAIAEAQKLLRGRKFAEAMAAYNAIIPAGGSEAAAAHAGLARVYLEQKNTDAAYAEAVKAVALTPDRAPAIVALGEVYFRQGKIPEAEDDFLKPLLACNLDARAYLGLNRVHRATLYWKRAKSEIDAAYKLDPDDPEIISAYLDSLSGAERIKVLEDELANSASDSAETREGLKNELTLLKGEADRGRPACHLATQVTSTETRLERLLEDPKHIRGYGLAVKVNGVPSTLMLDTGSSGIVIDRKIAEKAGIHSIVEMKIGGIGDKGASAGFLGHADKIRIGELEFDDCFVQVATGRSVLGDDGLIGADVFRHFLVDVDMPNEKFRLSQLPPLPNEQAGEISLDSESTGTAPLQDRYIAPEMKDYTRVLVIGHALLIPTAVNSFPPKLFLIDTGSFDNTLSVAAAKQVTKVSRDTDVEVKGLSGNVKEVYRASKATIEFSHFRQKREDLVTFDLTNFSNSVGTEVAGVLGFAMLGMLDMKIDYRDGLVNFTFDEKRRR